MLASVDQLYPFQQRALERLRPGRAALALRYGAGKSWIALEYTGACVATCRPDLTAIIFCRKRNVLTWQRELHKRCPRIDVLVGVPDLLKLLSAGYDLSQHDKPPILLMPHHRIRLNETELVRLLLIRHVAMMLMDESTVIKNPKALVTQAALRISACAPTHTHKLCLSGRMMPEGPHEIWSQYEFLYGGKNPLGPTYYEFLRRWFIKTDYAWALDLMKGKEFHQIIANHSVYMTEEDLVELQYAIGIQKERYMIEMYEESAEQRKALDHLYSKWALPLRYDGTFPNALPEIVHKSNPLDEIENEEYSHAIALMMKAQQIASGFYYTDNGQCINYLKQQPKIRLLIEIIKQLLQEAPARRIIVWHRFKAEEGSLQLAIAASGCGCVIGPHPEALLAFSNPGQDAPRVILMPAQTSQGFNELVLADTNIFFSNVYSSELRDQAEKRINRLGQTNKVIQHIDLCSPRQEDIEIVIALQTKDLTLARLNTIVRRCRNQLISENGVSAIC